MEETKIEIPMTRRERLGVAAFLQGAWGGSEAELNTLYDIREALDLAEFDAFFSLDANGVVQIATNPRLVDDERAFNTHLAPAAVRFVLSFYPRAATPGALGPAKVRLLRRLRAALTEQELSAVTGPDAADAAALPAS